MNTQNTKSAQLLTTTLINKNSDSTRSEGLSHSIKVIRNFTDFKNYIIQLFNFSLNKKNMANLPKSPNKSPDLNNNQVAPFRLTTVNEKDKNLTQAKATKQMELAAEKIEYLNTQAIGYCTELSSEDKSKYQQLNKLGSAILTHPNYSHEKGIFRKPGSQVSIALILTELSEGRSLTSEFICKENITIHSLASAYKKFATLLMQEKCDTVDKLPTLSLQNLANAVQNKVSILDNLYKNNTAPEDGNVLIADAMAKLENAFLSLEKTPLTLQLMIPIFTEITKNVKTNQMSPYNLATCFAPTLIDKAVFTNQSNINLSTIVKDPQIYLEALINHEIKLQSYSD